LAGEVAASAGLPVTLATATVAEQRGWSSRSGEQGGAACEREGFARGRRRQRRASATGEELRLATYDGHGCSDLLLGFEAFKAHQRRRIDGRTARGERETEGKRRRWRRAAPATTNGRSSGGRRGRSGLLVPFGSLSPPSKFQHNSLIQGRRKA